MDATSFFDEGFPSVAAGIDDFLVGVEDAAREKVLAEELPDVFLGVEFGAIGRKAQEREIVRYDQLAALNVPACAVDDDDGVRA